jgi:hypothetical protein
VQEFITALAAAGHCAEVHGEMIGKAGALRTAFPSSHSAADMTFRPAIHELLDGFMIRSPVEPLDPCTNPTPE